MPSFEESLHTVLKEKQLSDEDRKTYNHDATNIRNYLMEQMKERNPEFKAAFDGLSLTGSYLDKLKIDLPDEFDMHIKLKLPFNLTPRKDPRRPGFVVLIADTRNHPLIRKSGKLHRNSLQMWIRFLFLETIRGGILLNVNGRRYKVEYPKYGRGNGVAHTVSAKEFGGTKREIWFDFVPAFEFSPSEWPFKGDKFNKENRSWFAVPYGKKISGAGLSNRFNFMVCAPNYERTVLHDKKNLKNSLRLMKALRDANELNRLTSYMLKSVYLDNIYKLPLEFWEQPMGEILIAMLAALKNTLDNGCLPFFLHNGHNHLNQLPGKVVNSYKAKVETIFNHLNRLRDQQNVNPNEVLSLFIRKTFKMQTLKKNEKKRKMK